MRDESDKTSPVRIVLEPKSSRQDPAEFMQLLLANTRLESSLPVNLVMLGRDGRPRSKNLKQMIDEWIAFRFETVTRRTRHRLGEVDRRIHILEGRLLALLSIDKVIRIIRKADEPKADLMAEFGLTDVQAEDILEIRLRQLARLEGIKIETELKSLKSERKGLKHILADAKALSDLIVVGDRGGRHALRRQAAHADRGGRAGGAEPQRARRADHRDAVAQRLDPLAAGPRARRDAVRVEGRRRAAGDPRDAHRGSGRRARHAGPRVHDPRADIPGGRGDGVPVTTLIDLQPGAKVAQAICGEPAQKYLVAGTGGYGFVATLEDMVSRQRAGRAFMTLDPDEEPLAPVPLAAGLDHVAALSSRGRLLVFPLAEMREVPRGRGVIVIGLDGEETLAAVGLATASRVVLQGTNRLGRAVDGGDRGRGAGEAPAAPRAQGLAGRAEDQGHRVRARRVRDGFRHRS